MPVYRLPNELIFPDPKRATREGLLAVGGDLSPERLVLSYQLGIFPWYGEDEPVLWWSPDPRCIIRPDEFHLSRRLSRYLRQSGFEVSFNTALDKLGASLQGEYSYHQDAPLQIDDVELLVAALSPLGGLNPAFVDNQITNGEAASLDTYIRGYEEKDVSQLQMTMTKLFGPTFGADQLVMVGEAGVTHVHGMPSKSKMRFESPGTYVTGNPDQSVLPGLDPSKPLGGAHAGKPAESSDAFADDTSWGYRLVGKMDFNNAIGAVTLSPRIAWSHDVDGNTPGPGGSFIEDRKAVTYGIGASYQSTWSGDLSYTDYFGANRYNLLNDRDFVAFNIKYSF